MKLALLALAFVAGIAIAVQTAVNSQLRVRLHDPMHATLVSFVVGTVFAVLYCVSTRSPLPESTIISQSPWWIWTGGLLGVLFIWSSVVVGPRLGVAMFLTLVMAGQMITSLIIDHYGWLHMEAVKANPWRVIGVVIVMVGATIVTWTK
jgi:transporter family-2 protein